MTVGVGERQVAQLIVGRAGRDGQPRADLAVDLNRDDDFVGFRDIGIELPARLPS